jgi:hypothetical protein
MGKTWPFLAAIPCRHSLPPFLASEIPQHSATHISWIVHETRIQAVKLQLRVGSQGTKRASASVDEQQSTYCL